MSEPMMGLTLWQPWAAAIALGLKCVETRSWYTPYRGVLAIHGASRKIDLWKLPVNAFISWWTQEKRERDNGRMAAALTQGAVVCAARLIHVRRVEDGENIPNRQRCWGDYTPGRYAWTLENVVPLRKPVRCKGAQKLWTIGPELRAQIEAQMVDRP
jgi:hypothetical protein